MLSSFTSLINFIKWCAHIHTIHNVIHNQQPFLLHQTLLQCCGQMTSRNCISWLHSSELNCSIAPYYTMLTAITYWSNILDYKIYHQLSGKITASVHHMWFSGHQAGNWYYYCCSHTRVFGCCFLIITDKLFTPLCLCFWAVYTKDYK